MPRIIEIFVSDTDLFFSTGLKMLLEKHLAVSGCQVVFTANKNMMVFADLIFLTTKCLTAFRTADFLALEGCISKSVLITSDDGSSPAFHSVKWVLYRRSKPYDLFLLVDHILRISQNEVSGYALGAFSQPHLSGMTPRQRQVMWLISQGFTQKKISCILGITVKTVSSHKRTLMKRYHLESNADLRDWLVRRLLISV